MGEWRRFAVYYAPRAESAIARFGTAWLGWDAERGAEIEDPEIPGLPAPRSELIAMPARYGFHATLKAPFRLAPGATPDALDAALAELAAGLAPFLVPVQMADLGGAAAIVARGPVPEVDRLAGLCVRRLDPFRAPLTPAEMARRDPARLTERQRRSLAAWGYPYVLDDFRFHLSLTGPLPAGVGAAVVAALAAAAAPALAAPMPVEDLCLFGEAASDRRFRLLARHPLRG
ncbi:DUF1045 domain-containing protein [Amaricoccus sp.]|uniref:DUF1045 domain-containing protein n=1 Tax=Amaricoccus sp. TaxID=1872485 RepID=UPI001B42BF71|nr:DUF1045 domain-containing protein [Amaricoccus sp.]MBP7241968.1 DUF1045 domain-containing protein [Amaricoccus sp.]